MTSNDVSYKSCRIPVTTKECVTFTKLTPPGMSLVCSRYMYMSCLLSLHGLSPCENKSQSTLYKNKKYFRAPFVVLQFVTNMSVNSVPGRTTTGILRSSCGPYRYQTLVTNRGLVSVPGRTNRYLEGPQWVLVVILPGTDTSSLYL